MIGVIDPAGTRRTIADSALGPWLAAQQGWVQIERRLGVAEPSSGHGRVNSPGMHAHPVAASERPGPDGCPTRPGPAVGLVVPLLAVAVPTRNPAAASALERPGPVPLVTGAT